MLVVDGSSGGKKSERQTLDGGDANSEDANGTISSILVCGEDSKKMRKDSNGSEWIRKDTNGYERIRNRRRPYSHLPYGWRTAARLGVAIDEFRTCCSPFD